MLSRAVAPRSAVERNWVEGKRRPPSSKRAQIEPENVTPQRCRFVRAGTIGRFDHQEQIAVDPNDALINVYFAAGTSLGAFFGVLSFTHPQKSRS